MTPAYLSALANNIPGSLGYQHPEYDRRLWWRKFWRISYLGGHEYLRPVDVSIDFQYPSLSKPIVSDSGTVSAAQVDAVLTETNYRLLHRFDREKSWEFENRCKRAAYLNIVRPVVHLLVSHTMKDPPVREGDEQLEELWGAVDERRTQNMDAFMRGVARWANVMGVWYVVADVCSVADGGDGKPYLYGVSPLDVLDWQTDEDGSFAWLKQLVMVEGKRTWNQPQTFRALYRIWTPEDVTTYTADGQPYVDESGTPAQRTHAFGRVPFEPVFSQRIEDYTFPDGMPLTADLAKQANRVFNYMSLADQIAYEQTFSQVIIPDETGSLDEVTFGLKRAFGYNPGSAGGKPEYISPDPEQVRVLLDLIANAIEQARQAVGVGRGRSEASLDQASGEAMQLQTEDKRSVLGDIAAELEDAERRIADMVLGMRNGGVAPEAKPIIKYSRDFDLRTFQAAVGEVLSMKTLGLPESVGKALNVELVRKRFANYPPEIVASLVRDVEAMQAPAPALAGANEGVVPEQRKPGAMMPKPDADDDSSSNAA